MSDHLDTTGHTARKIRGWLVPIGILLIAGLLITLVVLELRPDQPETGPHGQSSADGTVDGLTVVPTTVPDLTQFEDRDPADVQAAGPVDAPVALVIFSDYQCKFCAKWSQNTLPTMLEYADAGLLRIEWRDISMYGEHSERAAAAAHAAGIQGQFWEFHDALYPNGTQRSPADLSEESLLTTAIELGLDTEQFARDMDAPTTQALMQGFAQTGRALGVTGTPSFILGGRPLVGAQPTEVFVDALERALTDVDAQAGDTK